MLIYFLAVDLKQTGCNVLTINITALISAGSNYKFLNKTDLFESPSAHIVRRNLVRDHIFVAV